MDNTLRILGIVAIALCLLPAGCVGGAAYWYSVNADWRERAEPVEGVVVDFEEESDADGTMYATVYRYVHDGEEYTRTSTVKQSPKPYSRGERIPVLVNPDDPHDAMIDGWMQRYLGPVILGGLSLIPMVLLLIGGVIMLAISRTSPGSNEAPPPTRPGNR